MIRSHRKITNLPALVVGLRGIGRQVALQLASLGVQTLMLIDAGRVDPAEAATDGYFAEDVGRCRRHATAGLCHQINPAMAIETNTRVSSHKLDLHTAVLVCGLEAPAEQAVWRQVCDRQAFYASVNITAYMIRIRVAWDSSSTRRYERWLHRQDAGHRVSAGLRPVPLHVAAVAAGLMILQFGRFLAGGKPASDVWLDLSTLRPPARNLA